MSYGYLVPCDCGHDLTVKPSEAGQEVRCPLCRSQHQVPRLSELRRSPFIVELPGEQPIHQSIPRTIAGWACFVALFWGCYQWFGFNLMACIVLFSMELGVGVALFHRAFVHASVVAAVFAMFLCLTLTSLQRSRAEARLNTGFDSLRQLGGAYKTADDYRTHGRVSSIVDPKQPSAHQVSAGEQNSIMESDRRGAGTSE